MTPQPREPTAGASPEMRAYMAGEITAEEYVRRIMAAYGSSGRGTGTVEGDDLNVRHFGPDHDSGPMSAAEAATFTVEGGDGE